MAMNRGYISKLKPTKWEEGMLCGNGTIGALVMGETVHERIIFSHEWLYAPLHLPLPPVHTAETLSEIRRLLAEKKYQEAANFVVEQGKKEGFYEEMFWTDPFVPACMLTVDADSDQADSGYEKALNFENGVSKTSFSLNGVQFVREAFVSRPDGIAVLRVKTDRPACYHIALKELSETDEPNHWWNVGYPQNMTPPVVTVTGDTVRYDESFKTVKYGYSCAAKIAKTDGAFDSEPNGFVVKNATETLVFFNVVMCDDMAHPEDPSAAFNTLPVCFDTLLERHAKVHGEIYNRISLDLDDPESDAALAETLWNRGRTEPTPPNGYFKRIFDAGRYQILCASGKTPPNLQGIWSGTNHPMWSGDYTQNGNLQTAILGALPSNLFEAMDSFVNYEEYLIPDNQINAERLYGAKGMMLACRGSRSGLANHFGHRWCMTFWTAGAAWNAHFFYDYFLYTGDREVFMNHALPYMKEVDLFYRDFLIEDETGHWLFTPSYSPENNPTGSEAQACVNATMDIAVAKELYHNLIEGCKTLGIEAENIAVWQKMLDKMPDYMINEDGALKEWTVPDLKDRYDHRHSSHLYMLYYNLPDEIKNNKALYDACEKAYEYRMKYKNEERGAMAFGNIQMAFSAAHLKDSKTVWDLLCVMAQNNYYPTFASSHDMGPAIFNSDISGGYPALMLEALIESRPVADESGRIVSYEIELLPNLPEQWSKGSIKGVRARGGFTLDFSWENGTVKEYHVINPLNNKFTVIGA